MPAYLQSELPVLARTRHHWVILLRRPHLLLALALLVLLIAAVIKPWPMGALFLLVFGTFGFVRWQTWQAEWVILTSRRIIRVRGVPETTSAEASLRLDRISGAVLEQTVLGKLLNFGTIELEAPGQHPDVRRLVNIARPHEFYLQTRRVVFGNDQDIDPNYLPQNHATTPLPKQPPDAGW